MSTIDSRIAIALRDDDACHAIRVIAHDLMREGVERQELNRAFLSALSLFPRNVPRDYAYRQELKETLELLCLWSSEYHPEFPAPWFSGQAFENYKPEHLVREAEAWLRNALIAMQRGDAVGD